MGEEWLDGPEAREAIKIMGGLEAALEDPARLFELMADIREAAEDQPLARWLREHHLSMPALTELLARVATDDGPAPKERAGEVYTWPMRGSVRKAVVTLDLHAVPADVIARLLDEDGDVVERFLAWRSKRNPKQHDVMRLHFEGRTVVQISRELHVAKQRVYDLLDRAGVEPNREERHPSLRRKIVTLRNQGRSYADIRRLTGANTNQIRNALRHAAAEGKVPDYGRRRTAA